MNYTASSLGSKRRGNLWIMCIGCTKTILCNIFFYLFLRTPKKI